MSTAASGLSPEWLTVYSNGNDTGTGYSCAGSGTYGLQFQCVELVMRHFETHWGLHWSGNAKDLLNNAPKSTVDVYMNGDGAHPPVPGDMIVWTNGAYGHVALVTNVHAGGIDILEQNVKGNGHATLSWDGATIGARWGNWIPKGWAHAKASSSVGMGGAGGASSSSTTTSASTSTTSTTSSSTTSSSSTGGGNPPTVQWSCGSSAYNGQQYWTCSNGNIYRCQNGVPEEQMCANGCNSNPLGTNDTCKSATPANWSCASSAYNGKQYWTCSGGNIYECQNGVAVEQTCPSGCKSNPLGTDDVCL